MVSSSKIIHSSFGNIFAIAVTIILVFLNYLSNENVFEHTWLQAVSYVLPTIALVVFNNAILIPYFFDKQRFVLYTFALVFFILITQAISGYFTFPHYFNLQIGILVAEFIEYFIIVTAGFGFIALQRLSYQQKQNVEQQLLINQSELKSLKSQINPHFLFNTLNNIYFLCLDKSDKAAEMVEKLSSLMRYTLENTEKDYVPLEKEFNFIKNYIDLESSRLPDSGMVSLNRKGNFANVRIAPLILISFVENCFKHGANQNAKNPNIDVFMEYINGELSFYCENNKSKLPSKIAKSETGLVNVKTRLNLIYPEKHTLTIEETESAYKVSLIIKL